MIRVSLSRRTTVLTAVAAASLAVISSVGAHPAGPDETGARLPSGRRVTPAGDQVRVGGFPQAVALSPDGRLLAVADVPEGPQMVSLVDTETLLSQTIAPFNNKNTPPGDPFAPSTVFDGLAFSPDGSRLWVSGGSQGNIISFRVTPAGLAQDPTGTIAVPGNNTIVGPMVLDGDASHLYVVDAARKSQRILSVDATTGTVASQVALNGDRPFAIVASPARVYVAAMATGDVLTLDPQLTGVTARMHVGIRPMALALAGNDLLVADANADEIVVLDAETLNVRQRVDLSIVPGGLGSSPNAIAVRGDRAAVTLGGANALAILGKSAGGWSYRGALPTAWTPEAVALSADGNTAYVANARGVDSLVFPATVQNYGPSPVGGWAGTVSRIRIPGDLSASSAQVAANNKVQQAADTSFLSPDGPIKHVVFILRENKTFDCLLGDTPGGDPEFVLFPETNTPSLHALASRYAVLTDMYADAEASDEGHHWATGGYVTDFVDRFWPAHDASDTNIWGSGNDPIEYPAPGYIFDAAERAGITWRDYGEFLRKESRGGPYRPELATHRHPTYPGWDQSIPDTTREAIWEAEFSSQSEMPAFSFIWLPNDHGLAIDDTSNPTFQQQVADNDLATGRVVEAISHSPFWPSTAIFLTEDDPQGCMDHVEMRRTIGLVISPWARRGLVDVHTDTIGMVRTMEMLLGLEPLSSFDANARAVPEVFTDAPDFTPFVAPPEGFGQTPPPAALARARALAASVSRLGPDQIEPAIQLDYAYLSVYGVLASEYLERIHRVLPTRDLDDD